ncbi:hypothetical protein BKA70DRAFT_1332034 [Coprinopsis sp. MPI-PUGE-AT-0042]|nr:hypothetical protein BKA70DRAFT_1332034 [Coprinopsis sp. MPI-PUGE-AT-0042]
MRPLGFLTLLTATLLTASGVSGEKNSNVHAYSDHRGNVGVGVSFGQQKSHHAFAYTNNRKTVGAGLSSGNERSNHVAVKVETDRRGNAEARLQVGFAFG